MEESSRPARQGHRSGPVSHQQETEKPPPFRVHVTSRDTHSTAVCGRRGGSRVSSRPRVLGFHPNISSVCFKELFQQCNGPENKCYYPLVTDKGHGSGFCTMSSTAQPQKWVNASGWRLAVPRASPAATCLAFGDRPWRQPGFPLLPELCGSAFAFFMQRSLFQGAQDHPRNN